MLSENILIGHPPNLLKYIIGHMKQLLQVLNGKGPAIEHHNKHNRHHPEHFLNGISDAASLKASTASDRSGPPEAILCDAGGIEAVPVNLMNSCFIRFAQIAQDRRSPSIAYLTTNQGRPYLQARTGAAWTGSLASSPGRKIDNHKGESVVNN